jgi:hypothetical protein
MNKDIDVAPDCTVLQVHKELPVVIENMSEKEIVPDKMTGAGVRLGKLDFVQDSKKNAKLSNAQTVIPMKQTIG